MWDLAEIVRHLGAAAIPFGAAVVGALVGGLVTLFVARRESLRARRERYAQSLLDALGSARVAVRAMRARAATEEYLASTAQAPEYASDVAEPIVRWREARDIQVNAHLASQLERRRSARNAMHGWALHHHESLLAGSMHVSELEWLDEQLLLGEYLVIAWAAGRAPGADFRLPKSAVLEKYGPQFRELDVPDYGSPRRAAAP